MSQLVKIIYMSVFFLAIWCVMILNIYHRTLSSIERDPNFRASRREQWLFGRDFNKLKTNTDKRDGNEMFKRSFLSEINVLKKPTENIKLSDFRRIRNFLAEMGSGVTSFENKNVLRPTPMRTTKFRSAPKKFKSFMKSPLRYLPVTFRKSNGLFAKFIAKNIRNKVSSTALPKITSQKTSENAVTKTQLQKQLYFVKNVTEAVVKTYGLPFSIQDTTKTFKRTGEIESLALSKVTKTKKVTASNKVWFLAGGTIRPNACATNKTTGERIARLYPEEDPGQDRIPNQLMFVPPKNTMHENKVVMKKIFLFDYDAWGVPIGRKEFIRQQCPVNNCVITNNRSDIRTADAVIMRNNYQMDHNNRSHSQIWILQMLENPQNTRVMEHFNIVVNWTASYRSDSTIVSPYERWYYYNGTVTHATQNINYALNKTKKVAWVVSNCNAPNNRMQYAKELQKYIEVDIYGACGTKSCSRYPGKCFEMLGKDYKFYLSFENYNCREYITEKLFYNALMHNIVPVVMGAHPDDYARVSPYNSYIHVDDFKSPKELADYLHRLDRNDCLYNDHMQWKGTGEFINIKFFCRVCALLHDTKARSEEYTWHHNFAKWWWAKDVCIYGSWRDFDRRKQAGTETNETLSLRDEHA